MTSLVESLIRMAYVPEGRFLRVKVYSVPDWPAVGQLASGLRRPTTKHRAFVVRLLARSETTFKLLGSLPVMRVMVTGPEAPLHFRVNGVSSSIW